MPKKSQTKTIRELKKALRSSWTNISVSMHVNTREAVARIADKESVGVSELFRRALAEYAAKHGYQSESENFEVAS
jgi:hypothetical protein